MFRVLILLFKDNPPLFLLNLILLPSLALAVHPLQPEITFGVLLVITLINTFGNMITSYNTRLQKHFYGITPDELFKAYAEKAIIEMKEKLEQQLKEQNNDSTPNQ